MTGSTSTTGSATAQPPISATGTAAATGSMATQAAAAPASNQQANPEAAKQHLTAARNSLSEMTQLPAAAQLSGDARTQITQLISNFNELITTNSEWRASYAKVEANLTALLGSETTDESTARTTASGTAGAVGTSGTVAALDPGVRGKLIDFRNHLEKFELAAGGPKTGEPASPAAAAAANEPTMTSQSAASQPPAAPSGQVNHQEVIRHIQAIEAILQSAGSPAAGTSATGTTGSTTGSTQAGLTLTAVQAEQLRNHLNELKRLFNEK